MKKLKVRQDIQALCKVVLLKLVDVDDFLLTRWKFEKGRLNLIEVQKRIPDLSERRLTLVPVVRLPCSFVFRFKDP